MPQRLKLALRIRVRRGHPRRHGRVHGALEVRPADVEPGELAGMEDVVMELGERGGVRVVVLG